MALIASNHSEWQTRWLEAIVSGAKVEQRTGRSGPYWVTVGFGPEQLDCKHGNIMFACQTCKDAASAMLAMYVNGPGINLEGLLENKE